jgi:type IV secretory pathway VirB2 component (pilin)
VLAGPALSLLASTSGSLADPAGASVLVAAVSWLQQTILGTVATTIAIIAVASVGLSMLNGRVSVRYGMTVLIGCFILLGASTIAAGIRSFVGGGDAVSYAPEPPPVVLPPAPPPAPPAPANNDPYAGASVPSR